MASVASVEDRWTRVVDGKRIKTPRYGQGARWRARYRDATGRERAKAFDRQVDAERWVRAQVADVERGDWVDPRDGRLTFAEWAARWQKAQLHHRASTRARLDADLRNHLLPTFKERPIAGIQRADVQGWVSALVAADRLKPSTIEGAYRLLATIMRAALEDRRIKVTPCRKIKLPEVVRGNVSIPTLAELEAITGALPKQYRRVVPVVAGTGLRQGEVLGLTVDRVDFLRRRLTVDRQLQTLPGGSVEHVPVKRPASNRWLPLAIVTRELLSAQIDEFPPGDDGLVFRNTAGRPIRRNSWGEAWADACVRAKVEGYTLHDVRHFYASLLISKGLSVKVVQARLGHASADETLNTYAHLWPDDEDRTRAAIDDLLGAGAEDLVTTAADA